MGNFVTSKSSIKTIEVSVAQINSRIKQNQECCDDMFAKIEKKFLSLEKIVDDKINTYYNEAEKSTKTQIITTTKNLDNKVGSLKQLFNNFKDTMDMKLTKNDEVKIDEGKMVTINNKISKLEEVIAQINIDVVFNYLKTLKKEYNETTKQINEKIKWIEAHFVTHRHQSTLSELNKNAETHTMHLNQTYMGPEANSTLNSRSVNNDTQPKYGNTNIANGEINLMICLHPNRRYLNFRRLWSIKGTRIKSCGNLKEVIDTINDLDASSNLKYFLMNVGCNDLEVRSPNLLFTSIRETLQNLREKFPGIIIILCEVTPRCDILDVQVKEVNSMIYA